MTNESADLFFWMHFGKAVAYVVSGMHGDVKDLGTGNAILIIMHLSVAGFIVIILSQGISSFPLCDHPQCHNRMRLPRSAVAGCSSFFMSMAL